MRLRTQDGRLNLASLFGIVVVATTVSTTAVFVPLALLLALLGNPMTPLPPPGFLDLGPAGLVAYNALAMPVSGVLNGLINGLAVCGGLFILRLLRRDVTVT